MLRNFFRVYEKCIVYYVVSSRQIRVYEKIYNILRKIYNILCRHKKNIKRGNGNVKKLDEILRCFF